LITHGRTIWFAGIDLDHPLIEFIADQGIAVAQAHSALEAERLAVRIGVGEVLGQWLQSPPRKGAPTRSQ
jgi:hypothetical protein